MGTFTLRALRINAGISAKEAAAAVGINEDTLYRYESGKSSPQIGTALKLAKLYGVSIDVIDFGVDNGSE